MCVRVDANGRSSGKNTHISVFVYLMRGEFDNDLKWPFRGDITIQLLNQLKDEGHCEKTISFTDKATPDRNAGRVTTKERACGWGYDKFIPHTELTFNHAKYCQYLMDDCLRFQVPIKGGIENGVTLIS